MKATAILAAVLATATVDAAVIKQVIVRQQWPWSTDVKVEYKLAEVTAPVDISVRAFNGNAELPLPASAMKGDLYGVSESGIGQFVIDPVKAFGNTKVAIADFRVELEVTESAANINEVLYKIFDLTSGECTDVTRSELLNGKYGAVETDFANIGNGFNTPLSDVIIWTGVTNYPGTKTTKLVMRKIPAASREWMIGAPDDEASYNYKNDREKQHKVVLTEDFFIGVFEFTQGQWKTIGKTLYDTQNPSEFSGAEDSDFRPVDSVSYGCHLRGWPDLAGQKTGEKVNWPTNSYMHDIVSSRWLSALRSKLKGVPFDLPTEAQWEFACRAGTTTALYSGKNVSIYSSSTPCPNVEELAWTRYADVSTLPGGTNQSHPVGLKKPNAFGLYDMLGNISEWCLNYYSDDISTGGDEPYENPCGPGSASGSGVPNGSRVIRGSDWSSTQYYTRSAYRNNHRQYESVPISNGNVLGFRVVCPAASDWVK